MAGGAYVDLKGLALLRHRAQGFSYLPSQPVHSVLSGRKQARLRGRGLDFDELRHYRPGDDIRHMDWRVTRRTGAPHVRVYTEERDRPVWVLVDQRLSMFFGSRHQLKSVAAAETAALTAWRVIGVGDRVGAILFSDDELNTFTPSRTEGALMAWLEQLTSLNNALNTGASAQPRSTALGDALRALRHRIGHDGLVVVISDFEGWDSRCQTAMKDIIRDNDAIAVVVDDPLERSIEHAHRLVVGDGQHQLEIDTQRPGTADRYRASFQDTRHRLEESLRRLGMPVIPISTHSEVSTQLQQQLGGKTVAKGRPR